MDDHETMETQVNEVIKDGIVHVRDRQEIDHPEVTGTNEEADILNIGANEKIEMIEIVHHIGIDLERIAMNDLIRHQEMVA